jgi:hypothetical protein
MAPEVRVDDGTDELLVVEALQDSEPNSPAPGDLESDRISKNSDIAESNDSSKEQQPVARSEEQEEALDIGSMSSVDQTPDSPLGSDEVLPSTGRMEVSPS